MKQSRVMNFDAGTNTRPAAKADYVRSAKQTRFHNCHWPGCKKQVKPAMWGCFQHWTKLPKAIRDAIWRAYRPGQEESGAVSPQYIAAANAAQKWIAELLQRGQAK